MDSIPGLRRRPHSTEYTRPLPRSMAHVLDESDEGRQAVRRRNGRPCSLEEAKISIIVPTLNEAQNLSHVLPRVSEIPYIHEVILVDGWSTDDTIEKAMRILPDIKTTYQEGRGKGDALRHGWRCASGDILVTLDADGSMAPQEIPRLIQPLFDGYDLSKGSRYLRGGGSTDFSFHRHIGNRVLTTMANSLTGSSYSDLVYGFHAFWADILDKLDITSSSFTIDTELYVKARKAAFRVAEVPSFESKRIFGTSKLSSMRDGWRIMTIILREGLHRR